MNEVEVPDWKNQPYISDYLQQLGSQGCESVSVMEKKQDTGDWDRAFYLKRPRA